MMVSANVWRRVFLVKGVYNVAVSLAMLLWPTKLLPLAGAPTDNLTYAMLFLWVALACGVGYLIVGCDVDANHGVVVLGIIGQAAVFGVSAWYWLKGLVYAVGLVFGVIDLTFAIAFAIFLWTYAYRIPGPAPAKGAP
ncbi:MAG TPA: hypothetical protein VMQ73_26115 [Methylomirabilota bacterium]|nr:hypothetical protein [Methylomirabilota bacterium]